MTTPNDPMVEIGGELGRLQTETDASEARQLATARARFLESGTEPQRRTVTPWRWALVGAAAALATIALIWTFAKPTVPAFSVGGQPGEAAALIAAPDDAPMRVEFRDGGSVTLRARARARVQPASGGAKVTLESGATDVVAPDARFVIEAGPYRITSTDAEFSALWDRDAQALEVNVSRGRIEVMGPGLQSARVVEAGERLRLALDTVVAVADPPAAESGPSAEPAPDGARPKPRKRTKPRQWRALRKAGRNTDAIEAARKAGFGHLAKTLGASDLLELADLARFAASTKEAKSALTSLRARFPKSKEAAAASFRLGKLAFDRERAYGRAARHFSTYLKEHPSGPLARDAWHRLLESYHRGKQPARARTTAREYLERYPNGSQAAFARSLLDG